MTVRDIKMTFNTRYYAYRYFSFTYFVSKAYFGLA